MASLLFWSWIFIISLIRPGCALPVNSNVLAKRALEQTFTPEFSQDQLSSNIFVAFAITGAVIFVAVIIGLIVTVMRHRRKKVEEPEAGMVEPVDKPTWFMVETEKVQWWRNFRWHSSSTEDPDLPEGSRIERIKAALSRKKENPILPLYNDSKSLPSPPAAIVPPPPKSQPQYPDILERGYKAPLYQAPQQPATQVPVPTMTRAFYGSNKSQLRSPPKAVITQGHSRSLMRGDRRGFPRSPAARRKSWLSRAALHHPFLPVKDTASSMIAPLRTGVPKTRFISKPSPLQPIAESRSKLSVPIKPAMRPPPLDLDEEPRREIRFTSPKVWIAPSPRIRIVSPAF